jgi:hypothetical protein
MQMYKLCLLKFAINVLNLIYDVLLRYVVLLYVVILILYAMSVGLSYMTRPWRGTFSPVTQSSSCRTWARSTRLMRFGTLLVRQTATAQALLNFHHLLIGGVLKNNNK